MTRFRWGSCGDVGRVRQANQDHLLTVEGLFVVADGMGGHRAGEVASELAVVTLAEHFGDRTADQFVLAVQAANRAVVDQARDNPDFRGMGTTLSAIGLVNAGPGTDDALAVVNVGDSRVYLLRAESQDLEQITDDHSLVETLRRQGQLTEEEAAVHPQRNILTRALGTDAEVLVDSWELLPVAGDRYLICSDGLFNEVTESKIAAVLRRLDDPDEAAAELVRLANESGGKDNISVVILDVVEAATTVEGPGAERILKEVHGEQRSGAGHAIEAVPARPAPKGDAAEVAPPSVGADGAPTDGAPGTAETPAVAPSAPRSRFTWRVALFLLCFAGLIGGTVGLIIWYANAAYYVGVDQGEVIVFQGRPGGVLWIDPSPVGESGFTLDEVEQVSAVDAQRLRDKAEFDSRRAADDYVERLQDKIDQIGGGLGDALSGSPDPQDENGATGTVTDPVDDDGLADPTVPSPTP